MSVINAFIVGLGHSSNGFSSVIHILYLKWISCRFIHKRSQQFACSHWAPHVVRQNDAWYMWNEGGLCFFINCILFVVWVSFSHLCFYFNFCLVRSMMTIPENLLDVFLRTPHMYLFSMFIIQILFRLNLLKIPMAKESV